MKFLAVVIVTVASFIGAPASAQHHHHGGYYRAGGGWVAPLVGGVILGTIIARPSIAQPPVVVQQPPVVVQQPPIVVNPPYYGGIITRDYYSCLVQVYDPYTGQYRNEVQTCVR